MRVVEKEVNNNNSTEKKAQKKEEKRTENKKSEKQSQESKLGCLKTLGCLFFCLILVFLVIFCLIFFIAKPIVEKTNQLPKDFPKELIFHQINSAKIKIQEQENKLRAIKLIESLPNWLISPFINLLAANPIGQINLKSNKEENNNLIKIDNLEESLKDSTKNQEKTVSVFWKMENKEKEEILEYFKNKLNLEGYELKEDIRDYEFNLIFIKEEVSGVINIMDSFSKNNSTLINMTVNYLSK